MNSMTETLRDKLIRCGWVTNFNADTLVRLIERHYAALAQSESQGPTGHPAIEPVPVAERLPGPEDCDADGECWWWHPDHKEDEFSDGWMLLKHKWADGRHDCDDSPIHTHWLPHHALPVPQQEVQ